MTHQPFFSDLGVGVGLRPFYYNLFWQRPPQGVQWVEAVTENYMLWEDGGNRRPLQNLLKIRSHVPVVLHGVSLSIGSSDPLDASYLTRWKYLIDMVQPEWVSDHLSWSSLSGEYFHDLLPLPYSRDVASHVADKISRIQDFIGRPMLIENVSSYVEWNAGEMPEWEFINQIVAKSGCGLLLDINNVYVNSCNHSFDPFEYLRALPRSSIGQIHLAGHSKRKFAKGGSFLIDTHDQPICDEVWALYRWACGHIGQVSSMVERDDNFPDWTELQAELFKMEQIKREQADKNVASTVAATI